MTTHTTVTVVCLNCTGGTAPDGYGCAFCNAQGHLDVDRDPVTRGVPDGYTAWLPPTLPEYPLYQRCC